MRRSEADATPRWRLPALLAGTAGLAALVWLADPSTPGGPLPPCPFNLLSDLYCPGCGAARALHALLQLDLPRALTMNPLLVLAAPVIVLLALDWAGWRPTRLAGLVRRLGDARPWAVVVVAYAIARNLPWPPFEWLAPGALGG